MTDARVSVREKICYAMGDFSSNIAYRSVSMFLFVFFTDVAGLLPTAVGTLMLVARLGDAVSNFVMGIVADRTETRWGKFRPWILWGTLPLGIALSLVFTAPTGLGPSGRLGYAYATYLLYVFCYAAVSIPYGALLSAMSADDGERTSIGSFKMTGAFSGVLVTQGALLWLKSYYGNFSTPVYILSAVMVLLMPLAFFGTRERVRPPRAQKNDLRADLKDLLFRNRPWLAFVGVVFLAGLGCGLQNGVTLIYFKRYLGNEVLCASYLVSTSLASLVGAGATARCVAALGKRNLCALSLALYGLLCCGLYFCPPSATLPIFALGSVAAFFSAIFYTVVFVLISDLADYGEWKTGRRISGLVYSASSFMMKANGAASGLSLGLILAAWGYVGTDESTIPGAIPGIRMLFSWLPGVLSVVAAGAMMFFPLTTSMITRVTADLKRRRAES